MKRKKHKDLVLAHQILAAAKIIVEDLTKRGYDDRFAQEQYDQMRKDGHNDQSALRGLALIVKGYYNDEKDERKSK